RHIFNCSNNDSAPSTISIAHHSLFFRHYLLILYVYFRIFVRQYDKLSTILFSIFVSAVITSLKKPYIHANKMTFAHCYVSSIKIFFKFLLLLLYNVYFTATIATM